MAILDQYGNRARFAQAVNRNASRGPVFSQRDKNIHELIKPYDRKALAALSKKVIFNAGIPKETIRQKASYTVGSAFVPAYTGDGSEADARAGDEAETFLQEVYFPRLEVSENGFEWQDFLEMCSKAIDRDGEAFVMLTNHEDGEPALLAIPAYMVRSDRDSTLLGGESDGAKVNDGLIIDESTGKVLKYRVWADDETHEDVPAADMVHLFERDFPEQKRGFPAFSHALADILNNAESKQLEILRQLIVSNVFLVNKGGTAPREEDAGFSPVIDTTNDEVTLNEDIAPGIKYLESGADLESLKQENPGDIWRNFREDLNNEAVIGAGWSKTMVAIINRSTQGTAERADVERARLAIKARRRTMKRGAKRFTSWGLTSPRAPEVQRFNGWSFSEPARLSVDDGREDKARLEAVKSGALSESAYQADHGRTLEEHYTQKAKDITLANAIAAKFGLDPSDLQVRADAPPPESDESNESEDSPEQGEN